MDKPDHLISALVEEDRLLRELLERFTPAQQEQAAAGGSLGVKETVAHLAFWDSFTVRFFRAKLDPEVEPVAPPVDFEGQNSEELQRLCKLSFAEIMDLYSKSTRELLVFLQGHWHQLSGKQRHDFALPLKHRRHHRLMLAEMLARQGEGADSRENAGHA
jgi:hypothetical protein